MHGWPNARRGLRQQSPQRHAGSRPNPGSRCRPTPPIATAIARARAQTSNRQLPAPQPSNP
eukprot:3059525-Lingulodinium_polyedra.AAC.1